MRKLNLGCGKDIREGWTNVDRVTWAKGVLRYDLDEDLPPDGPWDLILMQDVMEHLKNPHFAVLSAIHVLSDDGALVIRGPHYTCRDSYTDITHRRALSSETIEHMLATANVEVSTTLLFEPWNQWMHWVNWIPYGKKIYESTFLAGLAPAKHVHVMIRRKR